MAKYASLQRIVLRSPSKYAKNMSNGTTPNLLAMKETSVDAANIAAGA
jgi:hypothetical protein